MKIKQLIETLKTMPEEAEVLTYNGLAEEHGFTVKVKLITKQDDVFYDKGDQPKIEEYNNQLVIIY